MPTPNGRFHIGHISGPYLKTDILARNLKFLGHDVKVMSGVDTYEAHVSLKGNRSFPYIIKQQLAQASAVI
ncbi:class I tRNA ligase family protein [Bathymodiolus heckerae thiotrophic gill symbiont]|uniref:class I tRNA ligase family protein n=1 Tax=Bathymodiolus heckerae thiotrophic gill symbiont TaxID=1052212 RepID=UPI003D18B393